MNYCKYCGKELKEQSKFCPYCGMSFESPQQIQQHQYATPTYYPIKHSGFAIASLVLGIIAVIFTGIIILWYVGIILGILAIVFGAIAYLGQEQDKYGLAGFICGIISIIISIVIILYFYFLTYRYMWFY